MSEVGSVDDSAHGSPVVVARRSLRPEAAARAPTVTRRVQTETADAATAEPGISDSMASRCDWPDAALAHLTSRRTRLPR